MPVTHGQQTFSLPWTSPGPESAQGHTVQVLKFTPVTREGLLRLNTKYRGWTPSPLTAHPLEAPAVFKQTEELSTILTLASAILTVPQRHTSPYGLQRVITTTSHTTSSGPAMGQAARGTGRAQGHPQSVVCHS